MQQQLCQDQMSNHQQPQQVMLCPVRLVYETQILVQPGEQIQPNQTLFINPQNPPPWIQNRAQNQVIYMQQLPNNLVSSVPQHMDQNQLYIQNYAYPQQMMNQMDQMRQMPNVMTQNMMGIGQNIAQNVTQNIAQNVGINVGQNVMPMTNVVQNIQKVGPNYSQNVSNERIVYSSGPNVANNTIAMANAHTIANNQVINNVNQTMQDRTAQMNQNLVNMQKVSELQGMRQQQTQNIRPPQVTVSPMQNVKFTPNVGDIRPITRPQMNNVANLNNQIPNNMQVNAMVKNKVPLPNKANPTNVMSNQVRNYNQTYYRPIQPRPMSVMPMVQNQYLPMQAGNQAPRPQTQILNTELSRKRKSESPDDTLKKIPNNVNNLNNQTQTNINQPVKVVQSEMKSEMGVNTIPVHREAKQLKTVATMSTGTQANIAKAKPQLGCIQKPMEIKAIQTNLVKDNINIQLDTDKLVRNTVFTQARGLLRTETQILLPDIISIEKIENTVATTASTTSTATHTDAPMPTSAVEKMVSDNLESLKEIPKEEVTTETAELTVPVIDNNIAIKDDVSNETANKEPENVVKDENIKIEIPKVEIKVETVEVTQPEKKEKTAVKESRKAKEANKKFTVTAISDFKGNELQIADGSVRKEDTDSFILTHVLDGYVIQESNTAFPIRKPLKEKTLYQNTELGTEQKKEESYRHRTEDGKVIKDNSRILAISDLNLSEDDKMKSDDENSDESCDDPFTNLTPATIKTWTVDQLATHLSKYKWTDTISVLLEHEIDGESLFLVSKPQLVQIGVSEAHAEVICEFIKK